MTEDMALSVKYLWCKHRELDSIHKIYKEKPDVCLGAFLLIRSWEAVNGAFLWLWASQTS